MPRRLRPADDTTAKGTLEALALLRKARRLLRAADAPLALRAAERAVKSADGAWRHAQRRQMRAACDTLDAATG